MCRHVPARGKVSAPVSTHLRADTCWHMNVIWKLGCADMCQHLEGADTWEGADTSRYRHVPTPLGANTCRHLWYQSYKLYLDTGMCWQMPAPGKVPTPRKVPTRAGMFQHIKVPAQVSTHLRADIWMLFGSWDVLTRVSTSKVPTPEKVPTRADTSRCRHVPTPLGADTCRHLCYQSYELYLDTGMCWHLERCRHVLACVNTSRCRHRCRHIYVPTHADIWMLFGSWDVLTCVSTSKVPTPEKVPTRANTSRCRHLCYQSYELYLDTGMCWQMPAPGKVPTPRKVPTRAGMCQHIKVPAQVSTHLFTIWLVSGMSARVGT